MTTTHAPAATSCTCLHTGGVSHRLCPEARRLLGAIGAAYFAGDLAGYMVAMGAYLKHKREAER